MPTINKPTISQTRKNEGKRKERMAIYNSEDKRLYLSMDGGDMFNQAITLILQDSKFQSYKTDEEIISNIRRRIGNVITEIRRDHQQLKAKYNADNKQTDSIADEEE